MKNPKIYILVMCDSGPVIAHNGLHAPVYRPEYTQAEALQVVDWLNGKDQPLPTMNMTDKPRHFRRCASFLLVGQQFGRAKRVDKGVNPA